MKKILPLLLLSLCLFSCREDHKVKKVVRAFYYWQSDNNLNSDTESQLVNYKTDKIYVKFFEVDYSQAMGNYPYDKLNAYGSVIRPPKSVSIVPTVFIKNEIFTYNTEKDLELLADNIVFLIGKRSGEVFKEAEMAHEIQIDCDWTASTRDKYFYLLRKIKSLSRKEISCTLRLYPYKYKEKMGVPPVDKAMLMCYNLIRPLTQSNKNSILDIKELSAYLDKPRSYPLHLDVALPVYSWAQWYQNGHFQKLVRLSPKELQSFAKRSKPMWYEVVKDTNIDWQDYYRSGDFIKYEDVPAKTINQAIALIKNNVRLDDQATIALFDLDDTTFSKYSDEEISGFYDSFSK